MMNSFRAEMEQVYDYIGFFSIASHHERGRLIVRSYPSFKRMTALNADDAMLMENSLKMQEGGKW